MHIKSNIRYCVLLHILVAGYINLHASDISLIKYNKNQSGNSTNLISYCQNNFEEENNEDGDIKRFTDLEKISVVCCITITKPYITHCLKSINLKKYRLLYIFTDIPPPVIHS